MAPRQNRKPESLPLRLHGSLWLSAGGRSIGGHGRMALLRAVAEHGSITHAAQAFGMSYKAAWDAVNSMNELSGLPLVERVTGGRCGGSTRLTDHGRRVVERYGEVDAVHQRFVQLLDQGAMDLDVEFSLLKVMTVKTSARNQWIGTVNAIRAGAVNDEVEVLLPGGARLAAIVTRASSEALGLKLKLPVIAMVKSSSVLLATDLQDAKVSARNRLEGVVTAVTPGAVNAEISVQSACGVAVVAIVTQASIEELSLRPGQSVTVLVKASDILLATAS